jgi:hypothetical protein
MIKVDVITALFSMGIYATGHRTFSAFKRYANLTDNDIQTLVNRKTEPLPVISYEEFYSNVKPQIKLLSCNKSNE